MILNSGLNSCDVHSIPSAFYWLVCLDHKLAIVLTIVMNNVIKMKNSIKSKPFYRYKDV